MKSRITVKDAGPELKVVNLDEHQTPTPAHRIALTDRELCRQFGIEYELMRDLVRSRAIHEVGPSENAVFGGLLAEDLTALAVGCRLVQMEGMPTLVAGRLISQLTHALLEATNGIRVLAVVVAQNKGSQVEVRGGTGDIFIPDELRPHTTLYDATVLLELVQAAMVGHPLKLPRAKMAIVKK